MNKYFDGEGEDRILLTPSLNGAVCLGNGKHKGIDIRCDECNFFSRCFPNGEAAEEIENWDGTDNQVMKGYVLRALKNMQMYYQKEALSESQTKALMQALKWATDDMTAQEAYDYYVTH